VNERSDISCQTRVQPPENKRTFRRESLRSDEGAAGEIVHDSTDDCVGGDSFEQGRAAGYDQEAEDQDGRDDCDYLLDSFFAGADACDVLGNRGAAVGAYAAALDDEIGVAFGAFDFCAQGHRRRIVA